MWQNAILCLAAHNSSDVLWLFPETLPQRHRFPFPPNLATAGQGATPSQQGASGLISLSDRSAPTLSGSFCNARSGLSQAASLTSATTSAAGPGSPKAYPDPVISGTLGGWRLSPKHRELISLFECPVCFKYVLPPILQCQAGHLVCNPCRQKLSRCPTCRGSLTPSIRNLAMEKVASAVLFPCKDATAEHENPLCSCPCPGSSCEWQGCLEELMSHLNHAHKDIVTISGKNITFFADNFNVPTHNIWVVMQSCLGHDFMVVLERRDKFQDHPQFFATVLFIGTKEQAENFAYRLELNGNGQKLIWEATTLSIHYGVAAAILNNKCLSFDMSRAQVFAQDRKLRIKVTILKCWK
ncbi:E3 ubiquitin-protein ligase SIAH2-like [Trichosurus vulpecula]|uniref:E3 ubiquitin-protein ligase SIAH2-like n=1 Tax=Trichosurus vulpecula TaxID=9337 RepID=UPI00186B1867|nr:E3 ubiquitin-protein ligase SIAH2-like [Trichosurus vulpecula]